MKGRTLLILAMAGTFCYSFLLVPTSSYTLQQALDQGLVKAEYKALGNSSRECVDVSILNLTNRNLKIKIDPGLQLHTHDPEQQDILITREEEVFVDAGTSKTAPLYGFCSQAINATPSEGPAFASADYGDEALRELAAYLNQHPTEPSIEQHAVWSISEGHPLAAILNAQDDNDNALREFCAEIREVETPWYDIEYGDVLDAPFADEPLKLEGKMEYKVDHRGTASLVCLDPDGELLVSFFEGRQRIPGPTYTQTFEFSATNMKRGDYRFQLLLNDEVEVEEVITL